MTLCWSEKLPEGIQMEVEMYNKVSTGMNFVEREKEVEQFWKDLGKVYPFTDEELSESIANKKAIIDEQYKEANSLSCAGV